MQSSTDVRNYVPDDFAETVLKVFTTSSLPEFNDIFDDELKLAHRDADKYGGQPKYPSVTAPCSLARNSYLRFTGPGEKYKWAAPVKQGAAFNASFPSGTLK